MIDLLAINARMNRMKEVLAAIEKIELEQVTKSSTATLSLMMHARDTLKTALKQDIKSLFGYKSQCSCKTCTAVSERVMDDILELI